MRKGLAAIALAALVLVAGLARAAEDTPPDIASAYWVERDGRPVAGAAIHRRLPMASLAKMMTALLVLEQNDPERTIAVSPAAARETGTRIGLRVGERFLVRDLLAAAIVASANDACRALADHFGGQGQGFVALMNRRAEALGLGDTRFADACGHDRNGQHSSAADLARLAAEVIRHPEYLRYSAMERATVRSADGRSFALKNTNALIGRYTGAIGLKSGYTPGAGTCLVALAERDGVRVLLVMLNARNRWWAADGMLDRAFAAGPP
jgi:D-alanyl-D-alanine carboxypeptidase (penicillin-binding protein 5/6)